MNWSFDRNSHNESLPSFENLFGLCQNFLGSEICEQRLVKKKVKIQPSIKHDISDLTTSSMTSIFSSIFSNLHSILPPVNPRRGFVKAIPCINACRDLMPFVEGCTKLVPQRSDAIVINTKLKEVLMPFVATEIFQQVGSCNKQHQQCLPVQDENLKSSQQMDACTLIDENPIDIICNSSDKCGDNRMEIDGDDDEEDEDIIFDMDCNADSDDEIVEVDSDEGGYDDDDEDDNDEIADSDDDDNDNDCSDWDEIDGVYSSQVTAVHDSNSLGASFYEVVAKWDSGVDEELRNLPKKPKLSFDFSLDCDDEFEKELVEANKKWNAFYCSRFKREIKSRKVSKKVSFPCDDDLLVVHRWEDFEGSRCGPWQQYAVDRDRFKRKIKESEKLLSKILLPEHRLKVFADIVGRLSVEE